MRKPGRFVSRLSAGGRSIAVPLSLAFFASTVPGCNKIQELTGGKTEEAAPATEETKTEETKEETKEEAKAEPKVDPQVEAHAIPIEEPKTGLELLLSFVPDDKAEYVIVRDASVVQEYAEEAQRFLDGPMAKLAGDPVAGSDFQDAQKSMAEAQAKGAELVAAVAASGIRPKDGIAIVKVGGKSVVVFGADDPAAFGKLATALGSDAKGAPDKCKKIDAAAGWNVCAEDQATLDGYKQASDVKPVQDALAKRLPGIDLEQANVLVNVTQGSNAVAAAITTLPGLVHAAVAIPNNPETAAVTTMLQPGESTTLAQVKAGEGFIWGKANAAQMGPMLGAMAGGAPPEVGKLLTSLSGEFLLAGSIDPGGLVFRAGISDASAFAPLIDQVIEGAKKDVPPEVPGIAGSKVVLEKATVQSSAGSADAIHFGISNAPQAEALRSFTGLNLDAWGFATANTLTFAIGPDATGVGKLMDSATGGPTAETLASLPQQLAAGFEAKEVSFAMHLPVDFLQGTHMQKLITSALEQVPNVKPDTVLAMTGLLAPISSATMWIAQPAGAEGPIVHLAVQGIGNRATDEGKAALDAAHRVVDGGDAATEFGTLATTFSSSPMKFAYVTRAGSEGPGGMVGSGIGALGAAGLVAFTLFLPKAANPELGDDLGVKPEEPPPPLEIKTTPKAPIHKPKPKKPKPKPVEPKVDPVEPKPDPKVDPIPVDPKVDPTKPVEPTKPKTRRPTPKADPKAPPKPTPG